MKISVAWLCDHLDMDWKKQDIKHLYKVFNQKTAEMEKIETSFFDFNLFAAARVTAITPQTITVVIPEWNLETQLPFRSDAKFNKIYLVYKSPELIWASPAHFNSDKDGLLPHFHIPEHEIAGAWKQKAEAEDIILEIDNKSLTHRPDLWGHYGFAREIAAILEIPLKPLNNNFEKLAAPGKNPFIIENQAPQACKRFIGCYFENFKDHGSNIFMALRLLRVGMRPINGIIDVTNYLMLETSQPSHAYDADRIKNKKIIIRMAKKDETLTLLDNSDLSLFAEDLLIADTEKALGLAGVKGGLNDSINETTKSVFFEVAHFDATTVRRGAARHKTRTDASARFEKTLDPNQLEITTSRFIELAQKYTIELTMIGNPIIIGKQDNTKTIIITHDFLVSRSGINLSTDQVIKPLQRLGFEIIHNPSKNSYNISIPTYRGTKDVQILEDILEEVIRMYGFETITPTNPTIQQKSENLMPLMRLRNIKKYLSSGAQMLEQQNYAFFDEDFMNKLDWKTEELIELAHPVSEQFKRLITTLIPNLLKNVYENFVSYDSLAFFECARSWNPLANKEHNEHKKVAGIFFEKRKPVDFYEHKQMIETLLKLCDIKEVSWKKVTPEITELNPWMRPFQVAELFVGNQSIGYAGKADPKLLARCDALPESDAFIFELDAEFLYNYKAPTIQLAALPKFQGSSFDLSMMVPLTLEAITIQKALEQVNSLIEQVALIDFFEKDSFQGQRSLAFRIWMRNPQATITKEEIETVTAQAIAAVEKQGATVRV